MSARGKERTKPAWCGGSSWMPKYILLRELSVSVVCPDP